MYAQRYDSKKLYVEPRRSPKHTFLSPANKFGQRSLSASSLSSHLSNSGMSNVKPLPGSLRQQIRLDAFKKNLADSKLSKTALHKAALKVEEDRSMFRPDPRSEIRQLQRQIAMLRQENNQLKGQRHSDMLLITKQNQLLGRLERELTELKAIPSYRQKQCECFLMEQYLDTIRGLELKISHLQQEKKEYKIEIRELVIKQEELKRELDEKEREKRREERENRQMRELKLREAKQLQVKQKQARQRDMRERQLREWQARQRQSREREARQLRKQRSKTKNGEGVMRYMQYLKNIRHRQIDQIDNILNE